MKKYLQDKLPVLIILGLVVFYFLPVFLDPTYTLFPAFDITGQYSGWRYYFVANFLKFGQIPLWNTNFFSGTPFLANPLTAMFYPPTWLFFILPIQQGFSYLYILDFSIIGTFTYLYARLIKLDKYSALISSIIFTFSGYNTLKIYAGHLSNLDGIMCFVVCIYFLEKLIQKMSMLNVFVLGGTLSLLLLSGHTQYIFYSLFALFIYTVMRSFTKLNFNYKNILSFLFSSIIAFLISSIQILPIIFHAGFTNRSGGLDIVSASSYASAFKSLILLILPHFYGDKTSFWAPGSFWENCMYVGIFPLILILFAIVKINKYIIIFSVLSLFALLFSLGNNTFVFPLFYYLIPGFKYFQIPPTILFIYSFSIAMLTGFGLSNLTNNIKRANPFINFLIKVITFISICLLLFLIFLPYKNFYNFAEKNIFKGKYAIGLNHLPLSNLIYKDLIELLFFLICTLIAFLLVKYIKNKTIPIGFIIFTVVFNLFIFSKEYLILTPIQKSYPPVDKNILEMLSKDKSYYRIVNDIIPPFPSTTNNLSSIDGYDPTFIKTYKQYLQRLGDMGNYKYGQYIGIGNLKSFDVLNELNVKYILSNEPLQNGELVKIYSKKDEFVYSIKNSQQRAYFVPNITLNEKLTITSYQPNKIVLKSQTYKNKLLVLSEIYYPGWKAYIDSKEVKIILFKSIFRSINLKNGIHNIEFRFNPLPYFYGKIISAVSLVIYLLVLSILIYRALKNT